MNEFQWSEAPTKSQWGAGMMVADIALSKDETLTLYAHKSALHLVAAALARPLTDEQIDAAEKAYAAKAVPAWTSNRHRAALMAAIYAARVIG